MNDKTHDADNKVSARRRLVRGVFAAPAVMTLVSGSALAAGSTSCVARQTQTQPLGINPADTWVRLPLYEFRNGNNYVRFISGSNIVALLPAGGVSFIQPGQFQCVEKVASGSNYSGYSVGSSYTPNPTPTAISPAAYVAVRVDSTGKVLGGELINGTNSGSAMSFTCWNSFGGANPFGRQA